MPATSPTAAGTGGAVEVRPERDVLDSDPVGHVPGVRRNQLGRSVLHFGEVLAQERSREQDLDEATGIPDRVELRIGQVPRGGAQRVGG